MWTSSVDDSYKIPTFPYVFVHITCVHCHIAEQNVKYILYFQLGGTIGDIEGMPFVEAFRQFQFTAGQENFCNIHVSLVPQVG